MKKTGPLDIDLFIQNLQEEFNKPIPEGLRADTLFRNLEEWTSLQALIVISSFDYDYGISISAEELRKANTIGDLFELVILKTEKE